jgi:pyroglutamyl-peptidase
MADRRILLLGFDPSDGDTLNAGWELAQKLQGARLEGHRVVAERLPLVVDASRSLLHNLLQRHKPALALVLGEQRDADRLAVVRTAVNLIDIRAADAAGVQYSEQPVVPGGPAAYFAGLPFRAIQQTWRVTAVPGCIALTAGTQLLNAAHYALQHWCVTQGQQQTRGGALLVPLLPEQAARQPSGPSLALPVALTGLEQLLQVTVG